MPLEGQEPAAAAQALSAGIDVELPNPNAYPELLRVTNTGDRAGDEVVQLYVRDVVSSVTRPVKELKGFERLTLEPGIAAVSTPPHPPAFARLPLGVLAKARSGVR